MSSLFNLYKHVYTLYYGCLRAYSEGTIKALAKLLFDHYAAVSNRPDILE